MRSRQHRRKLWRIIDREEQLLLRARPVRPEGDPEELLPNVLCRDLQHKVAVLRAADGAVPAEAPLLHLCVVLRLDEAGRAAHADGGPRPDADAQLGRLVADVAELAKGPLLERALAGDGHGEVAAGIRALVHRGEDVPDSRHDEEGAKGRLAGELGDHGVGGGHAVAGHDGGRGAVVGVHDGHDGVALADAPAALDELVPPGAKLDGTLEDKRRDEELLHLGLLFGVHDVELQRGGGDLGLLHDLEELGVSDTSIRAIIINLLLC